MISVLMSTYREPLSYIKMSVNSILKQTYSDFELIVIVDDPSNNGLIKLLEDYKAMDSRVRVLINDVNIGLTGSLNRALKAATGDYIARMDADDISDEKRFEKQIQYLEENQLDLIGCNIQNIDEDGNVYPSISVFPETQKLVIKEARFNSPLAHPTWFGRKVLFDHLDGYQDIDACEDYDFLVRAILNRYKLGNIQETLLQYRINSTGISSTKKSIQKTALYYIRKNYRHGRITTAGEYNEFLKSNEGIKKTQDLTLLYDKTSAYKKINNNNKIKKALCAVSILLSSKEARLLVINMLRERIEVR